MLIGGVEVAMKPGNNGSIVFKPVFSSTSAKSANSAIEVANSLLGNESTTKFLLSRAIMAREYLKTFGT